MKLNPNKCPMLPLQASAGQAAKRSAGNHSYGFALVATLMLLILLTIIAVGILSLSTVTLRSSNIDSANKRAQANARMALMIAIGQLQKELGPDQRISANSAILNEDSSSIRHRHWTGAWNSWKAGDGESSQHSTIVDVSDEMAPTYLPSRSDYFRQWLVSLNDDEASSISSPLDLALQAAPMPSETDDAIVLVGQGSLGENPTDVSNYVAARLLDIKDLSTSEVTGRYGWWVGDESQKASIMDDSYEASSSLTLAEKISRSQAPASMGTKTIQGLIDLQNDAQLTALPSLGTLDLVTGVIGRPSQSNFFDVTPYCFQVLSDVREGGLKRDLSTLLERPISTSETGDEFMLYRFDSEGESRVPIQDLAAYYQLYYNDPSWSVGRRGGMVYDGESSTEPFRVKVPNYGTKDDREKYLRQYSSLYTSPVPVKVEFVLAYGASEITSEERQYILDKYNTIDRRGRRGSPTIVRDTDTHKLLIGVIPVVSLWNPNNVPMVIERGNRQIFKLCTPPFAFRLSKYRTNGPRYTGGYFNLNYALTGASTADGRNEQGEPYVMQFKFAETESVTFEPGEVKIFSVPAGAANSGQSNLDGLGLRLAKELYEPTNDWDPFGFFVTYHASIRERYDNSDVFDFAADEGGRSGYNKAGWRMVFEPGDRITVETVPEGAPGAGGRWRSNRGLDISVGSEIRGSAFNMWLAGYEHTKSGHLPAINQGQGRAGDDKTYHFKNYQMISKFGDDPGDFANKLILQGFPRGEKIDFQSSLNATSGQDIIAQSSAIGGKGFLYFSMAAACEANTKNLVGNAAGRKAATRPFLHGSTIAAPLIDQLDKSALYNVGWNWEIQRINDVEEVIQMAPGTGNSFFGGGYTSTAGTTHVIQQHLPVLPPISIASLSNAHLGGFSLANQPVTLEANDDVHLAKFQATSRSPYRRGWGNKPFQKVTATGAAGLAPHIMQAIGNSYAHPNIPADQASTTYTRSLNTSLPAPTIPFVDHSYLANKALWDEFFFSSMTPQSSSTVFESNRDLATVAQEFFFGSQSMPLPNRRMTPYYHGFDQEKLDYLIEQADLYTDGLADKIAAHLMVEGPFNVNSTSVEAWKVFLSSLKGKPISYLNEGEVSEQTPNGAPMNSGMLANAELVKSDAINDFNTPPEQWKAGREITTREIDELAEAIVKQVKIRGPFLSLSEFVNRRLENRSSPLALKGALQAALDDDSVTINANFRTEDRMLDSEVGDGSDFVFPNAAKGPIAYGSTAYVDQADMLQHFAGQLTPRGDTFVIRTYGDALDKNGKVIARAWCEAIVQRVPEYIDPADEPHLKQSDSSLSAASKIFGRKIHIIRFRWLNANEV